MGNFVAERFENADAIISVAKARFYQTNLYGPLERLKNRQANTKLWDRLNDKKKLCAFYGKMKKAFEKGGNNDFGSEWIKRPDFVAALNAFDRVLNLSKDSDLALIDSILIPFVRSCETEELSVNFKGR